MGQLKAVSAGAPGSPCRACRQGRAVARPVGAQRHRVPDRHRARHRRVRSGERRLHGAAMRLYIFMSADYRRNLDRNGAPTKAFEPSLFVCATVMSRPTEERAIVDAGLKALAFDSGPPLVWDEPTAGYERAPG